MFSGIVWGMFEVVGVKHSPRLLTYSIQLCPELVEGLVVGASVAVDGTCQTVTRIDGMTVSFDAIQETLDRTTLDGLVPGKRVNIERALRFGDEIGGHLLSGHVFGTATIELIENGSVFQIKCATDWLKYILPKGFIAIDGASLTVVDVSEQGFSVHLIPETLRLCTLGVKKVGDAVNIEIDSQTQAIVDTVERIQIKGV